MGLSTNGENTALSALLAGRYLSLHVADPGNTGASEVAGGAYARQPVNFVLTGGNPSIFWNNAVIQFPVATAPWGVISFFGIWTAAVGGTFLGGAAVDDPKEIDVDDVARWLANKLKVTMD